MMITQILELAPILFIVLLLLLLPAFIVRMFIKFPNIKDLEDYEKEKVLDLFVEHNENIESLHSARSVNGLGTTYFTISKFKMNGEKFKIVAKMYVILLIPLPYVIGYLACFDNNKIIASVSKRNFKTIKEEINDKILGK